MTETRKIVVQLTETRKSGERIIFEEDSVVQMWNNETGRQELHAWESYMGFLKNLELDFFSNIQSSLLNILSRPLLQPLPLESPYASTFYFI